MGISVCLIAKNEEKWIGGCLSHLKPVIDEIIVLDTGSTDRTKEIALEQEARVSQIAWEDDFAKARNQSLDKATQNWVLIIDPDERISQKDLEKLKVLTEDHSVMAYSFQTRNYTENVMASGFKKCQGEYAEEKGYLGYFESKKIRLFQNIPGVRFVGSVHELVESTIHGKTIESDIPFHHFGSSRAAQAEKGKQAFYQKQTKKKVREEPQNWKAHFEQGLEYLGFGDYKKAVEALERSRQLNSKEALVLNNLGYAYMENAQLDEATATLKACLKLDSRNLDAFLNLGVTEMRKKNWNLSIQYFQKLLKMKPHSFLAYRNLGNCYAHLQKYREAAACFEKALKILPDYSDAKIDLGVVCYAGGRPDIAEKILAEALQKDPNSLRAQLVIDEIKDLKEKAAQTKK